MNNHRSGAHRAIRSGWPQACAFCTSIQRVLISYCGCPAKWCDQHSRPLKFARGTGVVPVSEKSSGFECDGLPAFRQKTSVNLLVDIAVTNLSGGRILTGHKHDISVPRYYDHLISVCFERRSLNLQCWKNTDQKL